MAIHTQITCDNIDWENVAQLLAFYGLSNDPADLQQQIFTRSYAVVFLFDDKQLIGVGRALSDGICQAAIYNIALEQKYHGQGLGKIIVNALIEQVKQCNIILYTHPNTVSLYEHLGFRKMKTGMARYREESILELETLNFI